jgi:LysR family transcriptional regulator, transcriptional activator of the cysJI operon
MEDHRLKAYCLVVETKSFSRAALAKHMTQSAMSRLVKGLEDELGVKLLHRKGKIIAPTTAGSIFYDHAKQLLDGYVRMGRDISSAVRSARGALRLGLSRTAAALLSQTLSDFLTERPEMRIDLTITGTDGVLRNLREGRIDLGIAEGPGIDDAAVSELLIQDEVVVIAPKRHPLSGKKTVTPQDLQTLPIILPGRGSGMRLLADAFLRDQGIDLARLNVRMTVGSSDFAVQMVEAGLGLAFASKQAALSAVKAGTVKALPTPGKKILRAFFLLCSGREPLPAAARAFREFVKQRRLSPQS